jgi:catechol 2,3-dioxygenase-like lactoylglutathione lyase family enzyme
MLDHIGFAVSDYARSKAFYEEALAPLGIHVVLEPAGDAAGFGQTAIPSSGARRKGAR